VPVRRRLIANDAAREALTPPIQTIPTTVKQIRAFFMYRLSEFEGAA
jgi:hypothetical protein